MQGNLDLSNNSFVGASTSMSTRVETHIGANCRYGGGSWTTPTCNGNQDSRHIWSKKTPPNYVVGVTSPAPLIPVPVSDFAAWYRDSVPGPSTDCTASNGARTGTPPVFENETVNATRNNSVPTIFDLTPAASYTCRVGPVSNPYGELSWNATTKKLTVRGTIYIDGSVKVANGALNEYNGQATIYLSGTLLMNANTSLCGGISGGACDFAAWNPNTEMLTFVADGHGGQANLNNGVYMDNNCGVPGRHLRDVRRPVQEQLEVGRPDRRQYDHPRQQRDERRVPDRSRPSPSGCRTTRRSTRSRTRRSSTAASPPAPLLNEDSAHFLQRGQAGGDLAEAVVPQGLHAALERGALDVLAARMGRREP